MFYHKTDLDYLVFTSATPAQEDLRALLRQAEQGTLRVSPQTGRLNQAGMKVMQKALTVFDLYPEEVDPQPATCIRPYAWVQLLVGAPVAAAERRHFGADPQGAVDAVPAGRRSVEDRLGDLSGLGRLR